MSNDEEKDLRRRLREANASNAFLRDAIARTLTCARQDGLKVSVRYTMMCKTLAHALVGTRAEDGAP